MCIKDPIKKKTNHKEKIFSNYIFDKIFVYRMYLKQNKKKNLQLIYQKTTEFLKIGKRLKQTFHQKRYVNG